MGILSRRRARARSITPFILPTLFCQAAGARARSTTPFILPTLLHRAMTLASYVRALYTTVLQREPSDEEVRAWVDQGVVPVLNTLLPGFANSGEFLDILRRAPATDVITRFYRLILGREPDAAGLGGWLDYLARTGDWTGVATGFLTSREYLAGERSLADHIAILYRTFLGREPELGAVDAWLSLLASRLTLIQDGFTASPEFQNHIAALFRAQEGTPACP